MNRKILSFCLLLVTLSIVSTTALFSDDEQSSWWKQNQTFIPKDNGAFEVETTISQCYYTGNFEYEKDTINKGKNKGQVKKTKVTNTANYPAKAYINGSVVTFAAGETKNYPGDVSVKE